MLDFFGNGICLGPQFSFHSKSFNFLKTWILSYKAEIVRHKLQRYGFRIHFPSHIQNNILPNFTYDEKEQQFTIYLANLKTIRRCTQSLHHV